jgi:hypothetical protein
MKIQFNFGRKFVQRSFFITSELAQNKVAIRHDLYTFMFSKPYKAMVEELRAWVDQRDVITDIKKL